MGSIMGITITNSRIKTYQRCKRQSHYKDRKNLALNRPELPLKRGSWIHELLHEQSTTGLWLPKHKGLTREFMKMFPEEREMYGDLPGDCARIMSSYVLTYKKEDANSNVLFAEQEFTAKLPHGHTLLFKPDKVTEDEWGIWLWEHKTHKNFPRADYRFLDVQTARYVWGLRQNGIDCTGVLWDYIRTKPPTVPTLTKTGKVARVARMDTDLYTFVTGLKRLGVDPRDYRDKITALRQNNTFFRRERVPRPDRVVATLVKEAVVVADEIERGFVATRSIDRSCEYMCSFRDLCISDLYGGNTKLIIKQKYHVRKEGEYYGDRDEAIEDAS